MGSKKEDFLWLLVHYKEKNFDYLIRDRKNPSFLELVSDLGEEALKQQVMIPDMFNLYYKDRFGGGNMLPLNNEASLGGMVDSYSGHDTVDVWIVQTEEPSLSFLMALQMKKQKREAEERIQKEREEMYRRMAEAEEAERVRKEKEAEEERIRKEQEELEKPVVVEVPRVDLQSGEQDYVRVFSAPGYEESTCKVNEPDPTPPSTQPKYGTPPPAEGVPVVPQPPSTQAGTTPSSTQAGTPHSAQGVPVVPQEGGRKKMVAKKRVKTPTFKRQPSPPQTQQPSPPSPPQTEQQQEPQQQQQSPPSPPQTQEQSTPPFPQTV